MNCKGFSNKKIKYIHQNLRYYEWLICQDINYPLLMVYKNKMVTLKNFILKYIGMKNINILKRKCLVGINLLFLELILKLYDVCFMKNIFIALFWPSHKMSGCKQHMFTLWLFHTLLYFVEFCIIVKQFMTVCFY